MHGSQAAWNVTPCNGKQAVVVSLMCDELSRARGSSHQVQGIAAIASPDRALAQLLGSSANGPWPLSRKDAE
jgi:hypothetical protein